MADPDSTRRNEKLLRKSRACRIAPGSCIVMMCDHLSCIVATAISIPAMSLCLCDDYSLVYKSLVEIAKLVLSCHDSSYSIEIEFPEVSESSKARKFADLSPFLNIRPIGAFLKMKKIHSGFCSSPHAICRTRLNRIFRTRLQAASTHIFPTHRR